MEIEEVLFTKKFDSAYHKATLNIMYTSNYIQSLLKKQTDKESITLQQYNILRILRGQYPKPATINLLKERMLDRMSDVSRIVERLIQKKLISRTISEKDRRAVDILISQQGLQILSRLDKEMAMESVLGNQLTDKECEELSFLLDKMRKD